MAIQNLYQLFELPDYSDITLIKKAFRKQALKYHPDRNPDPGAIEIFKSALKAYEILSDEVLKQSYDRRLKNGFDFELPRTPISTEDTREDKKRWYAKMQHERNALNEVEQITDYENSLKTMAFFWRIILLSLLFITGILNIVSDWYIKGNKIAIGLILFALSSLFIWNEIYKYFWHKSLTKVETTYYKQSSSWFFALFLVGIFTTYGLILLKKTWQLYRFPTYVYATVNLSESQLVYTYNLSTYSIDLYKLPTQYANSKTVLIKISSQEPQIWEFVED